jgi:N6-adenosine-specific RNA methylase IME4
MKYRTIVADPPWPMPDTGVTTRGEADTKGGTWWGRHRGGTVTLGYPTMTLDEITTLPVAELAEDDAHLYLWTTNRFLEDAYAVARAWGFRVAQVLTWCKPPMGLGFGGAFTITTEFVLFARRGTLAHRQREDSSWWQWSRVYENGHIKHSAKPDAFLDMVEQVSPGPYLELFARRNRLGWDTWGNEALEHVALAGEGMENP